MLSFLKTARRRQEPVDSRKNAMDLSWVDEWIQRVRPYIFVRTSDQLLIRRPNMAQKLNASGARILKGLLDGKTITEVLDAVGRDPQRVRDVGLFLFEIRRSLEGKLSEFEHTSAVEVQPFDRAFSKLPVLSELAVTYRCNLRCNFCYAGCNCTSNPSGDESELSTEELERILDKIWRDGEVPSISFTGGEATLRRDLPKLISYAKKLGMRVNLISNGTRIDAAYARRLADAGLDSAQISIEGCSPEVHERVTRVPGSFRPSTAAVHALADAGIHVHSNTTIQGDNLEECAGMPDFVKEELGRDRFSMNLVIPTGSAALDERIVVPYSKLGPVLEDIVQKSTEAEVEFLWYSPTPLCFFNPITHGLGNKGCSACDGLISVAANGDVLPCASYDESVGNLCRQELSDVWEGGRARLHRDKFLAHPSCRDCEHFDLCHGACPLYWRQMGFGELEAQNGFPAVQKEHFAQ